MDKLTKETIDELYNSLPDFVANITGCDVGPTSDYYKSVVKLKAVIICPLTVGDYSMYIDSNLSIYNDITLYTQDSDIKYKVNEIVANGGGSVLYFDKKINNIFKPNEMYAALVEYK